MQELTRRFTDQEVAQVLQRATELEDRQPSELTPSRGLTLADLHEIGREVGLTPEVVNAAVTAVQANQRPRVGPALVAPLSAKLSWEVPGHLTPGALEQLLRLVEERVDMTGTVSEALGTVRWTSVRGHKFDRTVQVSLAAGESATRLQVVSRYPAALRAVLHLLPGLWSAMIAGAMAASSRLEAIPGLALAVGAAAAGVGIGRTIWQWLARRNRKQVARLATELVEEATALAGSGRDPVP